MSLERQRRIEHGVSRAAQSKEHGQPRGIPQRRDPGHEARSLLAGEGQRAASVQEVPEPGCIPTGPIVPAQPDAGEDGGGSRFGLEMRVRTKLQEQPNRLHRRPIS
jgi:hypothetical protein